MLGCDLSLSWFGFIQRDLCDLYAGPGQRQDQQDE
jgi:hypothetical protein